MGSSTANFLLDEICAYTLFSDLHSNHNSVITLLSLMEQCSFTFSRLNYSCDFYKREIGEITSSEIFFSEAAMRGEYRDEFLRFNRILDNSVKFDPLDYLTETTDELSDDFIEFLYNNEKTGVLSLNDYSKSDWWKNKYNIVNANYSPLKYCRNWIYHNDIQENQLWEIVPELFEGLYISPNLKLTNLGFPKRDILEWVINVFSYLNDYARRDFEKPDEFINRASAAGINLSPESPNTHKDTSKMALRDIDISGSSICCEWHAKYAPTKGRIHFHIGTNLADAVNTTTNDKVIIGIFCEHLD